MGNLSKSFSWQKRIPIYKMGLRRMQQNSRSDVVAIGESMVLFQTTDEKRIKYESLYLKRSERFVLFWKIS